MRVAVVLLVACLALSEAKPYDWKKWLSKRGSKSTLSEVSTSDVASSSGKKGGKGDFDWKKFLSSNSYIPSHVFEDAPEAQNAYDWKKWLSKRGSKSSLSEVSTSDVASSSGKKGGKGDFDWKKFLSSNSYIPSHVFEKAPETQDAYDWRKWLSNSYIPSEVLNSYIPSDIDFAPKKVRPGKTSKSGKGGKGDFDWKKFLSSNSYIPSHVFENAPETQDAYDWRKWLSNSYIPSEVLDSYIPSEIYYAPKKVRPSGKSGKTSKSGKGGKYDWKKWLSKRSSASVVTSDSGVSASDSGVSTSGSVSASASSGKGGYDWQKWLSKSGKGKGGYDWRKWLSKSNSDAGSDSSVVGSGSDSSVVGSGSDSSVVGSGSDSSQVVPSSSVPEGSSTSGGSGSTSQSSESGKGGKYDWKKWLSNSFGNSIPSSIKDKFSFSPFNWKSYLP